MKNNVYSYKFHRINLIIILITIVMMTQQTTAQPTFVQNYCPNTTMFVNGSAYQSNLNTLLRSLSSNSTNNPKGFHTATVYGNTANDPVYGLFLCRGDQKSTSCHDCVTTAATTDLPKVYCPNRKIAVIWYDECMVRYSTDNIFNKMDDELPVILYSTQNVSGNVSNFVSKEQVNLMINKIAPRAAEGDPLKKFAVDSLEYTAFQYIYGLGQCTPDLAVIDCMQCLLSSIKDFGMSRGAQVLSPSCVVRYEVYPFFDLAFLPPPPPQPSPTNNGSDSTSTPRSSNSDKTDSKDIRRTKRHLLHILLYVCIPMSIAISISALYFGVRKCMHKRKATATFNAEMDDMTAAESLQFELSTIRSATSNFSSDNKLGEGGFGQVHKGKLDGGQEIAVKRLSRDSRQGIAEFKTEVVVVAKLQHKNLVKLLGYCVTRTEKILIYEFLSKSSLDRFLFEPAKKACLDWETRFNIILGIARGLLYLHEDSRVKIIHRDLKSSNILLDEGMNPKIADFGLAKLFGMDETQGDTKRIVGTYGYMAPEYAITGHYSVKSDVYSFGVILLEIVSGQRNRVFRHQLEEAMLHRAWRLWNENNALDLVDPTLCNNFPREQVIQCIHIGLLCIQEDPAERPRMTPIVGALNGQSVSLSMPKAPHFFRVGSTSAENGKAMDEQSLYVYTGPKTISNLYPRD